MIDDRYLPGSPSKRLVKDVRRRLSGFGIRPNSFQMWAETWQWANQVRYSYVFPRWPSVSEIASQYMLLLLAEMKGSYCLKLPHRAVEQQPPAVRARLAASLPLAKMLEPGETPKQLAEGAAGA